MFDTIVLATDGSKSVERAVTVALDESDAERLTDETGYRIVTLPAEAQADREFASLLRNADETMATVIVEAGDVDSGSMSESPSWIRTS